MRILAVLCGSALLAACNEAVDQSAINNDALAARTERAPYCFFKDHETRAWTASRDSDGNIVVKGQAYRSDSRYRAVLERPKVEGASAEVWPTIVVNDTGYGAPDNWWDVGLTIPASSAAETVRVRCGRRILAELKPQRGP